jgi:HD-GYP domain-containing protein (c-di-GMP phosphodiesterase class II)
VSTAEITRAYVGEGVEDTPRKARRLAVRERLPAAALSLAFVAAAVGAAVAFGSPLPSVPVVVGLGIAYAAAFRLEFELGAGSAVPTQLVLVPMLFVLPPGFVPLVVAGAILAATTVESAQGLVDPQRVPFRLVNAWHAVGPAVVLGIAGETQPRLAHWPLYVGALSAQFALDFAVTFVRPGLPLGRRLRAVQSAYLMDTALSPIGLAIAFATVETPYAFLLALPLIALFSVFARDRRALIDQALELSHAYRGTAMLLGDVIEADDAYTGSHSRDVVDLTMRVADELGLTANDRRDAEFVALLHDVGKVRVPNEIINKAGPLTDEEREVMNGHTIAGQEMLEQVGGLLGEVGALVRSCHEHYDGSGYPDGLAGDDIPLLARIVACCDAFNAMTSDRSYRKAMSLDDAIAELRRVSGTQFDPQVVVALERVL